MSTVISINFRLSLLVGLVSCAGLFHLGMLRLPAIWSGMTLLCWYFYYREHDGHLPALLLGVAAIVIGVFPLMALLEGTHDRQATMVFAIAAYVCISHLAYALMRGGDVLRALGKATR